MCWTWSFVFQGFVSRQGAATGPACCFRTASSKSSIHTRHQAIQTGCCSVGRPPACSSQRCMRTGRVSRVSGEGVTHMPYIGTMPGADLPLPTWPCAYRASNTNTSRLRNRTAHVLCASEKAIPCMPATLGAGRWAQAKQGGYVELRVHSGTNIRAFRIG